MTVPGPSASVEEIQADYRRMVVDWAEARDDPPLSNKLFKKHHSFYKSIRDLTDGQTAIVRLMGDPEDAVRLLSATHSLGWAREEAERTLEELEQLSNLYAVDAKYTLKAFRDGKLNLDW
jgi:hypothetical protein